MHGVLLALTITFGISAVGSLALFFFVRGKAAVKADEMATLEQRIAEVTRSQKESQQELLELRDTRSAQASTLKSMESREQELRSELAALRQNHEQVQRERNELREAQGRLQTELVAERKNLQEQRKLLTEAEEKLRDTFKALSGEALEQSRNVFFGRGQTAVGTHAHYQR